MEKNGGTCVTLTLSLEFDYEVVAWTTWLVIQMDPSSNEFHSLKFYT